MAVVERVGFICVCEMKKSVYVVLVKCSGVMVGFPLC